MTPEKTTDRIRLMYANAFAWDMGDREERPDLRHLRDEQYAEFDAWLTKHDAEVAAATLEAARKMLQTAYKTEVPTALLSDGQQSAWRIGISRAHGIVRDYQRSLSAAAEGATR